MTCATSPVLGVLPVQHLVILLSRILLAKIHEKPNGSLWLSPFYIWARSFLLLLQETFHSLGLDQWAQLGWSFGGLPWQVCFQLWEKSLLHTRLALLGYTTSHSCLVHYLLVPFKTLPSGSGKPSHFFLCTIHLFSILISKFSNAITKIPNYFNENFIYKCLFYWKLINFYANQFNSKYRYSKAITTKFTVFALTEKYSIFKLAVKKNKEQMEYKQFVSDS